MISIDCEYCGDEYWAERSSRKYCSDSCKTLAYRKRRKQYEYNEAVRKSIEKLHLKWKQEDAEEAERRQQEELAQAERKQQEQLERAEKKRLEDEQLERERIEKQKRKQVEAEARKAASERKNKEIELYLRLFLAALPNVIDQIIAPSKHEAPPETKMEPVYSTRSL